MPSLNRTVVMIQGWSNQRLSRGLPTDTIYGRVLMLRRFQRFTAEWPWTWRPVDLDESTAELRGEQKSLPTIRAYQGSPLGRVVSLPVTQQLALSRSSL